jgi:hypothetical protein
LTRLRSFRDDWLTGPWGGPLERVDPHTADDDPSPKPRLEALLARGAAAHRCGDRGRAENLLLHVLGDALRRGPWSMRWNPAAALARLALAGGERETALKIIHVT